MLHISLENIPRKVVDISSAAIAICDTLEADLNSNTVKGIEAYIPASMGAIEGAKTVLTVAIGALQALKAIGDDEGLKGRLLTLSGQLTNLETEAAHEWGDIIRWVQTVFNHVRSKK